MPQRDVGAPCAVPFGSSFVPTGSAPGDQLVWDGFNWVIKPAPANPDGQVWTAGTGGIPFWGAK